MKLIFFFLFIVIVLIPISAESQQVNIGMDSYTIPWYYPSATFDNRFEVNYTPTFSCRGGDVYSKNHVKRVVVWNDKHERFFHAEFDRKGKVIKTGLRTNRFYIFTESIVYAPHVNATVKTYYENDQIVRVDTVISIQHRYEHMDTTIRYQKRNHSSYYAGSLLNEKNTYLNENYLGMPIINLMTPCIFSIGGLNDPDYVYEPPNYFDSPLRTDYDSNTLYLIETKSDISDFYATTNYDREEINIDEQPELREHPFVKGMNSYSSNNYCIEEGTCMNEPIHMHERMWCGSSMYSDNYEYFASTKYGYEVREDGLYDSFHLDFYAADTAKYEPPPRDTTLKLIATTPASLFAMDPLYTYNQSRIRRVSTPKRTPLYSFKYVFYAER